MAAHAPPCVPRLLYGTAWKRDRTADLVYAGLAAGFRGLDTAAQPRHYREDLVAAGVRRALRDGVVSRRRDLYIQTKFTLPAGQDWGDGDGDPAATGGLLPPYDRAAPLAEQVRASVEASLQNFTFGNEPAYIDCLVLHSPLPTVAATRAVWATLAAFVPDRVRALGVSNVDLPGLQVIVDVAQALWAASSSSSSPSPNPLYPAVVQNRFHARSPGDPYDAALRRFCRTRSSSFSSSSSPPIVYQAFWTLTANRALLRRAPCVAAVAAGAQVAPEVAFYGLVLALGESGGGGEQSSMTILDGTTSPEHMAADLAGLAQIDAWRGAAAGPGPAAWKAALVEFRLLVGDTGADDDILEA